MRLIDAILQQPGAVRVAAGHRVLELPGTGSFADALATTTHRYALQPCVAQAAAELAFGDEGLLDRSIDILRMPAASTWIEWIETPGLYGGEGAEGSRRVGVLVLADESQRSGTIQSFWCDAGRRPEASSAFLRFDFDGRRPGDTLALEVRAGDPRLTCLLRTLWMDVRDGWRQYYAATLAEPVAGAELRDALGQQIAADAPMVSAFALLLGARDALRPRVIDNAALNRARSRLGRPSLQDIVEVSMHLAPALRAKQAYAGTGVGRAMPRLHHVRGHLVRRNDLLIWRRPHLRGAGVDHRPRIIRTYL